LNTETKIISAEQVRAKYKNLWPTPWLVIFCADKTYTLETAENIKKMIGQCRRYKDLKFRDQIVDCDNFALSVWAEFCEIWGQTQGYYLPCPIGRASGLRFDGQNENHTVVTFLAKEGIFFFDPQASKIWTADSNQDFIFLVQM